MNPYLDDDHTPGPDDDYQAYRGWQREVVTGLAAQIAFRLGAFLALGTLLWFGKPVLMPLVLAIFLAILVSPLVIWLGGRGVPRAAAILVGEAVGLIPFGVLGLVFMVAVQPLQDKETIQKYQTGITEQLSAVVDDAIDSFGWKGTEDERAALKKELRNQVISGGVSEGAGLATSSGQITLGVVGYFFLTAVFTLFALIEGWRFREKIVEAFGGDNPLLTSLDAVATDVRAYVLTKTLISALTGLCVWLLLEAFGVEFAALWGLLAFPLNFIPTLGSIIASIPPVLVALVDSGMSGGGVVGVAFGLLAINGVIGSFLDPRYVGQAVKISPLVVFLSMLVWYSLWGPVGAVLAVPIMVSVKVYCSHVPGLEPIATLMKA